MKKLRKFEFNFVDYYTNWWLDEFYKKYIYKKEENDIFNKAFQKFINLLNSLENWNKILITRHFNLKRYYKYIKNIENKKFSRNTNKNLSEIKSVFINAEKLMGVENFEIIKNDNKNELKDIVINEKERQVLKDEIIKIIQRKQKEALLKYEMDENNNEYSENINFSQEKINKTQKNNNFIQSSQNIQDKFEQKYFSPSKKFKNPQKIDYIKLQKFKNKIGLKGEKIVLMEEKDYLISIGRKDLAEKISHVAKEKGDGLGYDILSFFEDGREKYIEVKTTNQSIDSQFYLSQNELEFMKKNVESFQIYRIQLSEKTEENFLRVIEAKDILEKGELIPTNYIVKI